MGKRSSHFYLNKTIWISSVISPSWSSTEEAKEARLSVAAEDRNQSAGTAAGPLWSSE